MGVRLPELRGRWGGAGEESACLRPLCAHGGHQGAIRPRRKADIRRVAEFKIYAPRASIGFVAFVLFMFAPAKTGRRGRYSGGASLYDHLPSAGQQGGVACVKILVIRGCGPA